MNRIFVGGALGALAMYFLDPRDGRRRRARTRDKVVHAARVLNDAGKVTARDTAHRARGMWATTRKLFKHEDVPDGVLVGRVRAELGRVVSHPHSVEVTAAGGHVTLSGPILAEEVRPLLRCVRRVDGVRAVSDRLAVHEDSAHVSGLQGGHPRPGSRFELMQDNWSPAARLATGGVGAAMLLASTRARGDEQEPHGASRTRSREPGDRGPEDDQRRRAGRAGVRVLDRLPELPALHAQRARSAGPGGPLDLAGDRAGGCAGAVDFQSGAARAQRAHRVALPL